MTSKVFVEKLKKIIERSEEFTTDTIDMAKIKHDSHKAGFDDVIFIVGENSEETFLLHVQKVIYDVVVQNDTEKMIADLENYGVPKEQSESVAVGLTCESGWRRKG